jgi:hypothetical protein
LIAVCSGRQPFFIILSRVIRKWQRVAVGFIVLIFGGINFTDYIDSDMENCSLPFYRRMIEGVMFEFISSSIIGVVQFGLWYRRYLKERKGQKKNREDKKTDLKVRFYFVFED